MILSAIPKAVTAEQMRELDASATRDYGIPSLILMENAGKAVAEKTIDVLKDISGKEVLIIAGQGNNGGDGFVAARHLHNADMSVVIAYYGDREKAKGDALANIEIAERMNLDIRVNSDLEELEELLVSCDVIVDALLGTGIKGEVRDPHAQIIELMKLYSAMNRRVIAVDIPSGLDADTGEVLGTAVWAHHTVTFALPKQGLVIYPGAEHVGELIVADIGIPRDRLSLGEGVWLLDRPYSDALTTPRKADAHKGSFGHIGVIAGSVGMTGAAAMAAEGALKMGAGLVTVGVPNSLNDILEAKLTEAMTIPLPETTHRAFAKHSLDEALNLLSKCDAAVIGPGFGRDEETVEFTLELIRRIECPAIIDADGLYAIASDINVLKQARVPLVLTPHPGEMARLLGTDTREVQSNRLDVAKSFAREYGVTLVLKGARTVIAHPSCICINMSGTPGMASGGVGDVLSGMIGTLLAQEVEPEISACDAVYLHGLAGELAEKEVGEVSLTATDLIRALPDAILEARRATWEKK